MIVLLIVTEKLVHGIIKGIFLFGTLGDEWQPMYGVVFFILPLEMHAGKEKERERARLKMAHIIFGCHELPRDQFVSINVKVGMNNTLRNCIFYTTYDCIGRSGSWYLFYSLFC